MIFHSENNQSPGPLIESRIKNGYINSSNNEPRNFVMNRFQRAILHSTLLTVLALCGSTTGGSIGKQTPVKPASTGTPSIKKIRMQIGRLLDDSLYRQCFIGCSILFPESGSILFERNSDKLFHPASTMKLLTSAAACNMLPADFRFITSISSRNPIRDSVLTGDLCVTGGGDPLLTYDDLDSLASQLAAAGLRRIEGDCIGDVGLFDSLWWGHGWMWDDEPDPDEAFLTPLTVERNSITVIVSPDSLPGGNARIELRPPTSFFSVVNTSVTTRDTAGKPVTVTRESRSNNLRISGTIHPTAEPVEFSLSVWKPEYYFLRLLKEQLEKHRIVISGTLRIDTARNGSTPNGSILATVAHPIDSVLYRMNRKSDNIAAENMLRVLAVTRENVRGSAEAGLFVVKRYCAGAGIDTVNMHLADGSGVSWYNEVSPGAITSLLTAQYRHPEIFRRFYESLSIAGIDGTLEHRMKGTRAAGNVHAKTGSLTGNSSIAGYVRTADKKMLAFCITMNHFPGEITLLRHLQDTILGVLASSKLSPK
jgi:serine-type D-Ala-D-Ala carboxypeptidase/endopeptidase (penicillin-binding protein 4)